MTVFFTLPGSASLKAVCKRLLKLTQGPFKFNKVRTWKGSVESFFTCWVENNELMSKNRV